MQLTPEEIRNNWDKLLKYIDTYVSDPRKQQLLDLHNKFEERLILLPASHKSQYHNAFPGGYVSHVLGVIDFAIELHNLWMSRRYHDTYTLEELVFSCICHDLGKMGDFENEAYLPSQDKWRKEKLGELYEYNKEIPFMTVPDRSLFLLYDWGIKLTRNEHLAIKLHDGLFDEANKAYLSSWMPETKPRSSIVYIIHMADMLAARNEFERDWFPKFKNSGEDSKENITLKSSKTSTPIKQQALGSIKSQKLKDMLDNI